MTADDHGDDHHGVEGAGETRETAPMQPYSDRDVIVGFAVLLVGIAVAYLVPALA